MEIIENRYTHFGAFLSICLLFVVVCCYEVVGHQILNYFSFHRFSARFPLNCQLSFLRVRYSRLNSMLWMCTRVFQRFRLIYARSSFVRLEFVFVRVINWICWFFLSFSKTIPYYMHTDTRTRGIQFTNDGLRAKASEIAENFRKYLERWRRRWLQNVSIFSRARFRFGLPFFRWIRLFAPVSLYFI